MKHTMVFSPEFLPIFPHACIACGCDTESAVIVPLGKAMHMDALSKLGLKAARTAGGILLGPIFGGLASAATGVATGADAVNAISIPVCDRCCQFLTENEQKQLRLESAGSFSTCRIQNRFFTARVEDGCVVLECDHPAFAEAIGQSNGGLIFKSPQECRDAIKQGSVHDAAVRAHSRPGAGTVVDSGHPLDDTMHSRLLEALRQTVKRYTPTFRGERKSVTLNLSQMTGINFKSVPTALRQLIETPKGKSGMGNVLEKDSNANYAFSMAMLRETMNEDAVLYGWFRQTIARKAKSNRAAAVWIAAGGLAIGIPSIWLSEAAWQLWLGIGLVVIGPLLGLAMFISHSRHIRTLDSEYPTSQA